MPETTITTGSPQPADEHSVSLASSPGLPAASTPAAFSSDGSLPPLPPSSSYSSSSLLLRSPTPMMTARPLSPDPPGQEEDSEGILINMASHPVRSIQDPGQMSAAQHDPFEELENGTSCNDAKGVDLLQVAQSLRARDHFRRQSDRVKERLHSLQVASARTVRLLHSAQTVQRTLAECIKSEEKHSFANLFDALLDASDCASVPPILEAGSSRPSTSGYEASPLDRIPETSRVALMRFCSLIRHDGDYIADRLASLSHKELLAILPDRNAPSCSESIFRSSSWQHGRASRHLGFAVDAHMDVLQSSGCASPLHTMIHCAASIGASSVSDESRLLEVWATVCAGLMAKKKPGSEKVVPAILDIIALSPGWSGKSRISQWISQTLERGAFLADKPTKQSYRTRVLGRSEVPAEETAVAEAFYNDSVSSFLNLLSDDGDGASVIPYPVLRLCHMIAAKLRSTTGDHRAFSHFATTRWLFSLFVPELLVFPEAYGMVTDVFISENMRRHILWEIAQRLQRVVYEVCSPLYVHAELVNSESTYTSRKYGSTTSAGITSQVQVIMIRLTDSIDIETDVAESAAHSQPSTERDQHVFMAVTVGDLVSMVKALFPPRRPVSLMSESETISSGLHSSSSSISGFSVFQNIVPSGSTSSSTGPPLEMPRSGATVHSSIAHTNIDIPDQPTLMRTPELIEPSGQCLWEACAILEDSCDVHDKTVGSWIMLLVKSAGHVSTTTWKELQLLQPDAVETTKSKSDPDWSRKCAKIIEELLLARQTFAKPLRRRHVNPPKAVTDLQRELLDRVDEEIHVANEQGDLVLAYVWSTKAPAFRTYVRGAEESQLRSIIQDVDRMAKRDTAMSKATIVACEGWINSMETTLESDLKAVAGIVRLSRQMRDKMWFVADVRTSAAYEETRSIANALRVMAKPKRQQRVQTSPLLRHWSAPKLSNGYLHMKSDAQVLELLSSPLSQGGPNKLSDSQSKATAQWMEMNNIENLCTGEERLHKLCMEIHKCVDKLIGTNAMVWSSPLFSREKLEGMTLASPSLAALQSTVSGRRPLTLRTNMQPSIESISSASHPLSSASSRDVMDVESPALTNRSSTFWSPTATECQPPSSATSVGSAHTQHAARSSSSLHVQDVSRPSAGRTDLLRRSLVSFLISDIALPLFADGSETDRAYWTGIGGEVSERHLRTIRRNTENKPFQDWLAEDDDVTLDLETAFATLLQRFSIARSPYHKLKILYEIDAMLEMRARLGGIQATTTTHAISDLLASSRKHVTLLTVDANVDGFRTLFCDSAIRPTTIFRDLQYIAALLPSDLLETTRQGRAFWNAGVAILGLKQELRTVMVETADSIIAYHANNRGHGRVSSTAQLERDSATFSTPTRTPSAEDIARYSMSDAACMLQIAAREGDRVAQREVATLYLTNPDLLDHMLAPFTQPKDVFREELKEKWKRNNDPQRCDPATMCVAHHWLSLSSKAGDSFAQSIIKQRQELSDLI